MNPLDLIVLVGTLAGIAAYGAWRTRGNRDLEGYLGGDHAMKWGTIGLSVMATQASAVTFLSTPGFGYEKGMEFVQNYFGLPLALIVVSALFIPVYYRSGVYTAYEYLERRFDLKTRQLGALLFLVQRGLAAGITIYAPAIIVSNLLGWDLNVTIVVTGLMVIAYTVTGGTRAVSLTQRHQMGVILTGMAVAFTIILIDLSKQVPLGTILPLAGRLGRMEVVSFSFDPSRRYTFWTGICGGFFLALSYFGTDQSQVGRYLTGRNVTECRMGLMFNALLKVPMQFFILLTGVMVFLFYQFTLPPLLFHRPAMEKVRASHHAEELANLETRYEATFVEKRDAVRALASAIGTGDAPAADAARARVSDLMAHGESIRDEAKVLVAQAAPGTKSKDSDYVFLTFIIQHLPHGIVGLLLAVIFCAAMSASASELNALGSTTTVDLYQRLFKPPDDDRRNVLVSKCLTAGWGVMAIGFAMAATLVENLIEAINILGSLFYGTILGIFLTAFLLKRVGGTAVFLAALLAEATVLTLYFTTDIGYLWYNLIGCALVLGLGALLAAVVPGAAAPPPGAPTDPSFVPPTNSANIPAANPRGGRV
ncbi:MAG TPA: sodium:solute symporter [Candidatus Polarisedimenticolia bacterium]|nr:sodium:solute symporter [Candidatus Polarisedimenticolia bacterium]